MSRGIVLGIVPSGSAAESAVDNLTEQDFSERNISVVMRNEPDARAVAGDAGPLKGVTASDLSARLTGLGLTQVDTYTTAVDQGQALIAVAAHGEDADAVKATLASYAARNVQEV